MGAIRYYYDKNDVILFKTFHPDFLDEEPPPDAWNALYVHPGMYVEFPIDWRDVFKVEETKIFGGPFGGTAT